MKQIQGTSKQRASMDTIVPAQARPVHTGRLHWFANDVRMFCRAIMLLLLFVLLLLWLATEAAVFKICLTMSHLRVKGERNHF